MISPEERKKKESEFHDRRERLRTVDPIEYERMTKNHRFYSVNFASKKFMDKWLRNHCSEDVRALDYCCGAGLNSLFMAQCGAQVVGIDISSASVESARTLLRENGLEAKAEFLVRDAESTGFESRSFDVILCNGVLHHLDLANAFSELERILKPGGHVICVEALAHNPVFQLYRRLTPNMRTAWEVEHILSRAEIKLAERYFSSVSPHFFHLLDLLAVPLRTSPVLFKPVLEFLDRFDRVLLSIPGLRWWAWQCVIILSAPRATTK